MIKKLFFAVAAILIFTVLTYLIGEAVVYVVFRKQIALFPRYVTGAQYGDYHIRRNVPNEQYRHKSVDGTWYFNINSQGFRSDETYSYEKPAGVTRILVLGDSFTSGYEVHREETYAAVLEDRLRKLGHKVQVINAGVSGFSNAEELIFLEQEGVKYKPDFVVLGFYDNDLTDNVRADLYRIRQGELVLNKKEYLPAVKQRDFLHSLPLYSWLSEYSYLHNYLSQAATVLVKNKVEQSNFESIIQESGIPAGEYHAALAWQLMKRIHEVARKNGAFFILMDIPKFDTEEPSFPRLKDPAGVSDAFLNAKDEIVKHKSEGFLYRPNAQRHWTEISHRAAGEALAEIISRQLKEKGEA